MLPLHQSPRNACFAGDSESSQVLANADRLYTDKRRSALGHQRTNNLRTPRMGRSVHFLGYP
jgi:hypothetical protein